MKPRDSAMMYQSYWESICDVAKLHGAECAGKLALEFFRLGIYGERTQKFDCLEEAIINVYMPLMLNSQENQDKAIQRTRGKNTADSGDNPKADVTASDLSTKIDLN